MLSRLRFGRIYGSSSHLALNPAILVCCLKTFVPILAFSSFTQSNKNITLLLFAIQTDVKVDIVVPTGAMGNITGGYMAKKMGVPIGMLCSGTNINDITYRVMQTGKFYKSSSMKRTLSEAINIQMVRRACIN